MCVSMWRRNKEEGTLAPEKRQTACLRSCILSCKVGHDAVIPKEHSLGASSHVIGSGYMAMNNDNEKPRKLLNRVMAKVMFKDLRYIPEERGKLRSQE